MSFLNYDRYYSRAPFSLLFFKSFLKLLSTTQTTTTIVLQLGYHLIDCAAAYSNELEIGVALREVMASGIVRREDLFVVSKLPPEFHNMQDVQVRLEVGKARDITSCVTCPAENIAGSAAGLR